MCDSILFSFIMFVLQNLFDVVCEWTNAEVRCAYKGNWEEIDDVGMKTIIRLNILIGFYKSENDNVLHLWSKEDGVFLLISFQKYCNFNYTGLRKTRSNDELGPIRDVLGVYLYFQDGYVTFLQFFIFCFCSCLWKMYFFFPEAISSAYVFFAFFCAPKTKCFFCLLWTINTDMNTVLLFSNFLFWTFWSKSWKNNTMTNS